MWRKYTLLLFLSCGIFSCKNQSEKSNKELTQETITFTKEGSLQIVKQDSTTIDLDIEFAESSYETETGLMYRESMETKQGMLFIFKESNLHNFYMKNTYLPLDLFFITEDQKIATIIKDARPLDESSLPSEVPVKYVLEVNAGSAQIWDIKEGDSISWQRTK